MYLNHDEIIDVVRAGHMLHIEESCINAASLDVRLGDTILIEAPKEEGSSFVLDYSKREKMKMVPVKLTDEGYIIAPGQFFLAHTIERCNFPDDLAALFRIKSSQGRIGMEHMDAGWVDPGFHGVLTLEFKNMSENHSILIRPNDRIGQIIFMRGNPVAADQSYRTKGNYNGSDGVKQVGYKDETS